LILDLRGRIEGRDADGNPHLTQPAFAQLLQVSPQTISRWERGVQDPPPRAIEMLEVIACNLGLGLDLELAFQWDRDKEAIWTADRAIIGLLRCLFALNSTALPIWTKQRRGELHRAAAAIFGTARALAADALLPTAHMTPAHRMLVGEITRLLEKIRDAEARAPGLCARRFGLPTYTDLEESVHQTADGAWEFTLDANWMGTQKKVYRGATRAEVLEAIRQDLHLPEGAKK
jgi:transcriptional regulator with XRE-family HTH domain